MQPDDASPQCLKTSTVLSDEDAYLSEAWLETNSNDKGSDESKEPEQLLNREPSWQDENLDKELYKRKRWAFCISGGGIRSATFGLGVIQGLAQKQLLDKFEYLSTVSGGGYAGSWLSAWAHRHPRGISGIQDDLNEALENGSERSEIRHLRSFSNYLTPKLGALSADTWTTIATYVRNLLLNWLVLIPLLAAALLTPQIGIAVVALSPFDPMTGYLKANLATFAFGAFACGAGALVWAMFFVGFNRPSAVTLYGRIAAGQGAFLRYCLVPVVSATILLSLSWAWHSRNIDPTGVGQGRDLFSIWDFIIAGAILRIIGWGISLPGPGEWQASAKRFMGTGADASSADTYRARNQAKEAPIALITGAIGGVLTWVAARTFHPFPHDAFGEAIFVCFAPPLLLLIFLTSELLYIGLASKLSNEADREWWARSGGWLLVVGLGWMALRILVLFGPVAVDWITGQIPEKVAALGGIAGIATALIGKSELTPATAGQQPKRWIANSISGVLVAVTAAIFLITLNALLSATLNDVLSAIASHNAPGKNDPAHPDYIAFTECSPTLQSSALCQAHAIPLGLTLAAIGALLALGVSVSLFVNVNKFSLHAMYRSRLIRAYLGASNSERKPNPFTGFDDGDDLRMRRLLRGAGSSFKPPPFHVVNVALNLVSGKNLAWQERKATSFTVSPMHCGSSTQGLGYRRSESYGGSNYAGIFLGTATTISGAAASPNMGYHSSPLITLIMTLFNARLGWWLGNPGAAGNRTYNLESPRFAVRPLISEAFGLTDDDNPYVYLSDGGHFENLGLYEMVRRRCRLILVSDAGCDPKFEFADLGNALRKIRIDLGVEIEFPELPKAYGWRDNRGTVIPSIDASYCAIGSIQYPELDEAGKKHEGFLIYLKPAMHGVEPTDVLNYAATHSAFPHEATSDQWFSESQFESYRRLGLHILTEEVDRLLESQGGNTADLAKALRSRGAT